MAKEKKGTDDAAQAGNAAAEADQEAGALAGLQRDEKKRPLFSVPAEHGEFTHHAEDAEKPCVTARGESVCSCGLYALIWSPAPAADIQAP